MAQDTRDRNSFEPKEIKAPQLESFIKGTPGLVIADAYEQNLEELFLLRNPKYKFDKNYQPQLKEFIATHYDEKASEEAGAWFYFPWPNTLTRTFLIFNF